MRFRPLLHVPALLGLLALAIGIWTHSGAVRAVSVTPLGEGPVLDDGLLGGDPDLRLDLRVDGRWVELGTFRDRALGEGLRWETEGPLARARLTAVRLVEEDPTGQDVLEERPVEGGAFDGQAVRFELETGLDLAVGLTWFLWTPLGLGLAAVVVGALLLSLLPAALETAVDVAG